MGAINDLLGGGNSSSASASSETKNSDDHSASSQTGSVNTGSQTIVTNTTTTDQGIVSASGRILDTGLQGVSRALEDGFNAVVSINDASAKALQGTYANFATSQAGIASSAVNSSADAATNAVSALAAVKGDTSARLPQILPWIIGGLVVIAGLFFYFRGNK